LPSNLRGFPRTFRQIDEPVFPALPEEPVSSSPVQAITRFTTHFASGGVLYIPTAFADTH
jgi:hypothetical protein